MSVKISVYEPAPFVYVLVPNVWKPGRHLTVKVF